MNKLLFAVVALILLYAACLRSADTARAGGLPASFEVEPRVGELGTTVHLRSDTWTPDTEVTIYGTFVVSLNSEPGDNAFDRPIASTTSNSQGAWDVDLLIADGPDLRIPSAPGFVLFRAISPNVPLTLTETVAIFAVTADGERPNGAGEIRLTMTLAPTAPPNRILVSWAWRRAGTGSFFVIGAPEGTALPFTTSIKWLEDGDWEVTAVGNFDLEPVGEGPIEIVEAPICTSSGCPTTSATVTYAVRNVSIRNGSAVDVRLVLGERDGDVSFPPAAGQGYTTAGPAGSLLVIVGALIGAGTVFVLAGCAVRRIVHS